MTQEYDIIRLGHHGDGIAEGPVYAPLTLPGERVSGDLEGGTLRNVRIVAPSDRRVAPVCSHYKSCGGCLIQHADDAFVADWKTSIVAQALAAHGLHPEMRGIDTSPAKSRRRASFSARRTKKGALVGFHMRAADTVIAVPNCQLLDPSILAAVPAIEAITVIGGSRKGELTALVTQSDAGLDIVVRGGKPLDETLRAQLAQEIARYDIARLTWEDEVIGMIVPPAQSFGAASVVPPAGAFLQATHHGEAALVRYVREIVGDAGRVIDLFAGCGTFALPLAETASVHAIEGDRAMVEALAHGARHAQGLRPVSVEARDLFRNPVIGDDLDYDAAVIDPPRAGAEAQTRELARAGVAKIAYVSCNPVTFARDASILAAAGYELSWVQVVDQFRWSSHVELVASFDGSKVDAQTTKNKFTLGRPR